MVDSANGVGSLDVRERTAIQQHNGGYIMATAVPNVISVDRDTKRIQFEGGKWVAYHNLSKNELIKLGSFLSVRWGGTPMHKSLDEIKNIVGAKFLGGEHTPRPIIKVTQPVPAVTVPVPSTGSSLDAVIEAMVANIMKTIPVGINHDEVANIVNEIVGPIAIDNAVALDRLNTKIDSIRPKVTEVHLPNRPKVELKGVQHEQFPKVLKALSKGLHLFLVGPAGTGKTTLAENASKALALPFSAQSFNAQSSKADLVGFMTANGNYVGTEFRKRFQDGGVYLMDEIDNANPNILGTLNAALANGYMAFPDGMVQRHEGFVAIAAGNTFGNGATAQYVGRNPIDGATKDRFVFMDIMIDEAIETTMVEATGVDMAQGAKWLQIVRSCRKNVTDFGLQVIVSPRASAQGANLLDAGFTFREAVEMTILKGAKVDQAEKILTGVAL
jgi:hypothetical protein